MSGTPGDELEAASDGVAPDVERSVRMVEATRALAARAADGSVTTAEAEAMVPVLVRMVGAVEASMNALAGQRTALVGLLSALVQAAPGTMVPLGPDEEPGPAERDHARRALVADLATSTGASAGTTATLVDTATTLVRDLPAVLGAMGTGALGDRQARQVVRHAEDLPVAALDAYAAGVLARVATDRTPAGLGRAARAIRDRVHPVTLGERHARASQERTVYVEPASDGMAWLTAFLPAVQATAIHDRLTRIAHGLKTGPQERRTLAQRRADALTGLTLDHDPWLLAEPPDSAGPRVTHGAGRAGLARSPSSAGAATVGRGPLRGTAPDDTPPDGTAPPDTELPGGNAAPDDGTAAGWGGPVPPWALDPALRALRPTVAVTVPALTLLGLADEPGQLDGYGPIDAATARTLAAHAPSFIRVLTHPETGTVLSVGRDRYTVPADLRTWLRLRDRTCRFPGCHHPATRSEIDHTIAYREDGADGATAAANLAHLCKAHHRLKHTSRWRVVQDAEAHLTWTSPSGQMHTTEPALRIETAPHDEPRSCGSRERDDGRPSSPDHSCVPEDSPSPDDSRALEDSPLHDDSPVPEDSPLSNDSRTPDDSRAPEDDQPAGRHHDP